MTTFFPSFTLCTRQGHHEMGWSGSGVLAGGWCSPPFGMLSPLLGMSGAEQQRSCRLAFCQGYTVYFRPHMAGRRKYLLDKTDPRWWCVRPGRRLRPPSHPLGATRVGNKEGQELGLAPADRRRVPASNRRTAALLLPCNGKEMAARVEMVSLCCVPNPPFFSGTRIATGRGGPAVSTCHNANTTIIRVVMRGWAVACQVMGGMELAD